MLEKYSEADEQLLTIPDVEEPEPEADEDAAENTETAALPDAETEKAPAHGLSDEKS